MGGSGFSKISEAKSIWPERPPSMEEVKQVVWDCDGSKAPGPDGFTFSFYKKVWNIISSEVFMLVKSFFRTSKLPKGISSSFVTLIPKSKGPSRFSHFRSISLIHGLYKIVTKLLSTRLRRVLTDVINVVVTQFWIHQDFLECYFISSIIYKNPKKLRKSLKFKKNILLDSTASFHKNRFHRVNTGQTMSTRVKMIFRAVSGQNLHFRPKPSSPGQYGSNHVDQGKK